MRFKRQQQHVYVPGKSTMNPPPVILTKDDKKRSGEFEEQSSSKKRKITDDEERSYMSALVAQFRTRLIHLLNVCKENDADFSKLKNDMLNEARLPRGVVQQAEKSMHLVNHEIENYLKAKAAKPPKKKNVEFWREYINQNFDSLKESVKQAQGTENDQDGVQNKADTEGTEDAEEPGQEEEEEQERVENNTNEVFKACSTSFNSIIRQDLSAEVRSTLVDTIASNIVQATNYMADYSKQVFKIVLLFTNHRFDLRNNDIVLVKQKGDSIQTLLPARYLEQDVLVPKPLNPQCIQTDELQKAYQSLFQEDHLAYIHSTYFGPRGVQPSTLQKMPFHKAIVNVLPRTEDTVNKNLSTHVMKMARNTYVTNFTNMWSNNKLVSKLLNKLIDNLLTIHLAPNRDKEFKQKREELRKNNKNKEKQAVVSNCSIPVESISLVNKTRNGIRRLFKTEIKRKNSYLVKGKMSQANMCDQRLKTYTKVLEREVNMESM